MNKPTCAKTRVGLKFQNIKILATDLYINNLELQTIRQQYVYSDGVNSPDYMVFQNKLYFFVKDHRGSINLVVDVETGNIAQRMQYSEFGEVTEDTNPGFQPFGFAGGLYDPETKLVRFGARDYDGRIGRWLSKDPIRFDGGDTNLYGYVLQDPVNAVDVNGEEPTEAQELVGEKLFDLGMIINEATTFKEYRKMSPKYFKDLNERQRYEKYLQDLEDKKLNRILTPCTTCPCVE